jgi:MoaA/NifB/PqqE/SkfB family radical SAM enzyme
MDYRTIERVKQGLGNPLIGPETIALMLTKACNLRCAYCRGGRADEQFNRPSDISDELSTQELFGIFEDAKEFRVQEINLGGMFGEPLCKKDAGKIIEKIKSLELVGAMTTNGSLLNAEMAKFLTDVRWDILLLSFDSADPAIQHALRPAYNKEPYFQNIIQFLETLNAMDSKLRILVNAVITKLNYRKFPELVTFANRYRNIESINVLKMLGIGLVNRTDIELNNEELKEFRSILLGLKGEKKIAYLGNWLEPQGPQTGIEVPQGISPASARKKRCFTNYYILSIDANGDIIKCPQYQSSVEGLNIRKRPLRELWKSEHLRFRAALAEGAPCFDGCCTILKEQNRLIDGYLVSGGDKHPGEIPL